VASRARSPETLIECKIERNHIHATSLKFVPPSLLHLEGNTALLWSARPLCVQSGPDQFAAMISRGGTGKSFCPAYPVEPGGRELRCRLGWGVPNGVCAKFSCRPSQPLSNQCVPVSRMYIKFSLYVLAIAILIALGASK
jgi:hypothetical protein